MAYGDTDRVVVGRMPETVMTESETVWLRSPITTPTKRPPEASTCGSTRSVNGGCEIGTSGMAGGAASATPLRKPHHEGAPPELTAEQAHASLLALIESIPKDERFRYRSPDLRTGEGFVIRTSRPNATSPPRRGIVP